MRCLICGIGSIGQRHFRNLLTLGHEPAVFRSRTVLTPFISDFMDEQEKNGHKVVVFYDFEQALRIFRPEVVFITNPNNLHLQTALPAAEFGSHLFIEKPLSHNLVGFSELFQIMEAKKLKIMVGYNLRFHPLLRKMRDMLAGGVIGSPLSAHVDLGENVEDWHPWEDYRQTYSIWKSGGGGIVLCFSHDLDYLYWFFGKPIKIVSLGGKMTPLAGDAEDMVKSIWEFSNGSIASLNLDYWQRPRRRIFEVVGSLGNLVWDQHGGVLKLSRRQGGSEVFNDPLGFERNLMFLDEVRRFISCIENDEIPPITLSEGIDVLEISLEVKKQIGF